jgi:hypothetical protein
MPVLADYTLKTDGVDWGDLLSAWAWLLPPEFTVWVANRFGDLFIAVGDGSVRRLDVGVGSVEKLADSRDEFSDAIDEGNNANDWLMIPLVDQLVAAGVKLGPNQCYSYLQLPVRGGDYTVGNTCVVSLSQHYKGFGHIHERIKDLPDGTRLKFDVADSARVWNRAALEDGGISPNAGDRALASLLLLHGLIMNGGVHHAIDCVGPLKLLAAADGYAYFGFPDVCAFFRGAAADPTLLAWTDRTEIVANQRYSEMVPDDSHLLARFEEVFRERRDQFAPIEAD